MRSTISGRRWKTMKLERTLARRIHRELANDSSTLTSPAMLSKRTNFVDQAKWDGTNGHKYSFYTQVTFAERDQSESLQLVLKLNEARRSSPRSGDFYRNARSNARRIDRSEPRFVSCPFNRTFTILAFLRSLATFLVVLWRSNVPSFILRLRIRIHRAMSVLYRHRRAEARCSLAAGRTHGDP